MGQGGIHLHLMILALLVHGRIQWKIQGVNRLGAQNKEE